AASTSRRLRARDEYNLGCDIGRVQLAGTAYGTEQFPDVAVMLGREHLGRSEYRRLTPGVDDLQHSAQRAHGLARADLALQQTVHRVGRGQVRRDLLANCQLAGGEPVRE